MTTQPNIIEAAFHDRDYVLVFDEPVARCQRLNSGQNNGLFKSAQYSFLSRLSLSLSVARGAWSVDDITPQPTDQSASNCWVAKRSASAATVATTFGYSYLLTLIQLTGGVKLVLKSLSSVFYMDVTQYMLKEPQNAVNCFHLVALNFSLDI